MTSPLGFKTQVAPMTNFKSKLQNGQGSNYIQKHHSILGFLDLHAVNKGQANKKNEKNENNNGREKQNVFSLSYT